MNRKAQSLRLFLLVALLLAALGCVGEKDKLTPDEFLNYMKESKISEVTIYKPAEGKAENHVEGRYRRPLPEGRTNLEFETDIKVDEGVLEQMKTYGVGTNFKN